MIVSVSPWAEFELTDAARYYTAHASAEVGLALIEEFERTLALLVEHPEIGAEWKRWRRFTLRRFPYSLIYTLKGDELRVIAFAHHRMKPAYWAGRS